jgi:hypothetical protein
VAVNFERAKAAIAVIDVSQISSRSPRVGAGDSKSDGEFAVGCGRRRSGDRAGLFGVVDLLARGSRPMGRFHRSGGLSCRGGFVIS